MNRSTMRWATSATLLGAMLLAALPVSGLEGDTFAISEINFEAGTIQITNHGEADVDPNGLIVCNFPDYAPVAGAPVLSPGESFEVDLNAIGIPADAADGEMGLYLDNNFESSDSIVAYVEWGSDGHQRSPVAQAATVAGSTVWDGAAVDGGAAVLSAANDFATSGADWIVTAQDDSADATDDAADTLPFTGISTGSLVAIGLGLVLGGLGTIGAGRRTRSI